VEPSMSIRIFFVRMAMVAEDRPEPETAMRIFFVRMAMVAIESSEAPALPNMATTIFLVVIATVATTSDKIASSSDTVGRRGSVVSVP